MRVNSVTLNLKELQAALLEYCKSQGATPTVVVIASHEKQIIVELGDNGLITCDEFQHRAYV
jgi:hypothetical protein